MSRSSSTFIQLIYPSPSFEIYGNSLTTRHVAGEIVAKWLHPYNYAPQNFGISFSVITIITGNPTLFLFDLVSAAPKHQRKVRLPNIHPSRWCHRAGVTASDSPNGQTPLLSLSLGFSRLSAPSQVGCTHRSDSSVLGSLFRI